MLDTTIRTDEIELNRETGADSGEDMEASPGRADYQILIVEDDRLAARSLELLLKTRYVVQCVGTGREAIEAVREHPVDLMLLDINLPDMTGVEVLREVRRLSTLVEVIMLTGVRDVPTVVECMKLGAMEYIQKPFETQELLLHVKRACEKRQLEREVVRLRSELYEPFRFCNIVGKSEAIREALNVARKMAQTDVNVLITGESGTGKELFARAIHFEGSRREGPFIALNCARYTGDLLDSELFGHEKGAFTGAVQSRRGRFEMADGGTLFLDEIATAQPDTQSKLLRVLEEKCFERVGGEQTIRVDVRIIAATNVDLQNAIAEGAFREDLYYRLNVARIHLPPLRERREDIPLLVDFFLKAHYAKRGKLIRGVDDDAMRLLMLHHWKGNVRELENQIQMSAELEEGEWITRRYFTSDILASETDPSAAEPSNKLAAAVGQFERAFLIAARRENNWNRRETARQLGVHRNTIEGKMAKYGIRPPQG